MAPSLFVHNPLCAFSSPHLPSLPTIPLASRSPTLLLPACLPLPLLDDETVPILQYVDGGDCPLWVTEDHHPVALTQGLLHDPAYTFMKKSTQPMGKSLQACEFYPPQLPSPAFPYQIYFSSTVYPKRTGSLRWSGGGRGGRRGGKGEEDVLTETVLSA